MKPGAFFIMAWSVILPSGLMMSYFSRRLGAKLQARVGPNRAGPAGIFQPVADCVKLLQKKDGSDEGTLWVALHTMALYSTVAVLPLGSLALLVDTDMSAFLPFWAALVLALGTMLLGLSQDSAPAWLQGVRAAAQAFAGAFPALVALLCVGIHAGGFKWSELAGIQGASPLSWTAFSNPFQFIAFVVFVVSGLVLLNGEVTFLHSGRRLSLFLFGRFYGFFLWAVITAVLFLGAWILPFKPRSSQTLEILELAYLLVKTFALMLALTWISRTNPRVRSDQITDFAWKVLSPFALAALIGAAILAAWGAIL